MTPAFPIDIHIEDPAWSGEIEDPDSAVRTALSAIWPLLDNPKIGELSLALVSDARICELNRDYRGKDKPTNVLSFPSAGPGAMLGDIVLARETIQSEAISAGKLFQDHLTHLIIHGFLHLQGYDHETEAEAEIMEGLEIQALDALDIDNPYKINERNDK